MATDDEITEVNPPRTVAIKIPAIKPIWVAWVIGQFFFCLAIVLLASPGYCLAVVSFMTGLSILLDCLIAVIIAGNNRKRDW